MITKYKKRANFGVGIYFLIFFAFMFFFMKYGINDDRWYLVLGASSFLFLWGIYSYIKAKDRSAVWLIALGLNLFGILILILLEDRAKDGKPQEQKKPEPQGKLGIVLFLFVAQFFIKGVVELINEDNVAKNNQTLELINQGNKDESIKMLEDVSKTAISNENKIITLINLAYQYEDEKAIKTFQEALALTNDSKSEYYLILGEIAMLQNNPSEALINYKKALSILPTDFQNNHALAVYYLGLKDENNQYTDYEKALEFFNLAYKYRDPNGINDETLKENIGVTYYYLEKYDQAIDSFLSMKHQDQGYIQYFLGLCYFMKKDYSKSKEHIDRAIYLGTEIDSSIMEVLNSI